MVFTPLLASWSEVMAFSKTVGREDFRCTPDEWNLIKNILHPAVEGRILAYCHRTDITAEDLEDDSYMEANLKLAECSFISNFFINLQDKRMGTMVKINDMEMMLSDPEIFTRNIRKLLDPYRVLHCEGIAPDG